MGNELCEQEGRAKIMCFTHGNPTPIIYEYSNVENEYHFQNMMAMALLIGHENGTFTDKAIGYYNGTWYHAVSCKGDGEDTKDPVKCDACGGTDFGEYDQDTIICQDCGNCQIFDGGDAE